MNKKDYEVITKILDNCDYKMLGISDNDFNNTKKNIDNLFSKKNTKNTKKINTRDIDRFREVVNCEDLSNSNVESFLLSFDNLITQGSGKQFISFVFDFSGLIFKEDVNPSIEKLTLSDFMNFIRE